MPTPSQLKAQIDTQITNKTQPYSILNTDVGARLKDIIDLIISPDVFNASEDFSTNTRAGYIIETVLIVPADEGTMTIDIGTASGADDIVEDVVISATSPVILLNRYCPDNSPIYFTGITGNCTIKIYYK